MGMSYVGNDLAWDFINQRFPLAKFNSVKV